MGNEHWSIVELGSIAKYINGRAFKPSEWESNGLPIIRIQNLTKSTDVINYTNNQYEDKYLVVNGDLLMAWSATLDVFIWNEGNAWLNQHIFKVKENESKVYRMFLYYTLKVAIAELYSLTHGSGMVHITKPLFETHKVPLPSLKEQQQIVDKLDSILPKVRKVKDRLEKLPALLKKFRQSVLSAACTGKLTEDWREVNKLSTKEHHRVKLSEVVLSLKYGTSKKCEPEPNGTLVLRIPNIQIGYIDYSVVKYAELDVVEKKKLQLEEGDLLLVRSNGSVDLVGRTALVTNRDINSSYAGYLIRLRLNKTKVYPAYLNYAFQTYDMRVQIELPARSTTGVNNINTTEVNNLEVNLPSLDEQQEIVSRVDKLFTLANSLEAKYNKAIKRIEKIEQSVLARAFRGELIL